MLFLLIILVTFLFQFFFTSLPWWIIAPIAGVLAFLLGRRNGQAFGAGFWGVFLVWAGVALWSHLRSDGRLTPQIAAMLGLPGELGWVLIPVAALVGGLVGGLAALTGYALRRGLLRERKRHGYYRPR